MMTDKDKPSIFKKDGKTYYRKRKDVENARNKGERIYYEAYEQAYYIITPNKRSYWGIENVPKENVIERRFNNFFDRFETIIGFSFGWFLILIMVCILVYIYLVAVGVVR